MKRTQMAQSRKTNSWWWDSHISPQNSKWLSENLEEMEKQVKEMLGFIEEEEGEFSAEKAEAYYQKRPLLITHVKNFYHMYHALAERYDSVTGELRKNIPSSLHSHGSFGISESDSETQSSSPSLEPDVQEMMPQQKQKPLPDCSDVSVGSGVSSEVSKKGSVGSSSSSESDSELEEAKEENSSIFYALSQKIIELEDELHEARGKLDTLEEKNMHCQCDFGTDSKVSEHEDKLQSSDMESNNLQNDVEERASALESLTEVDSEKEALEAVLLEHKNEIEVLKGAMTSAAKQFEVELAHRDLEIDKCRHELGALSEKYLHDKSTLEAELRKLQGVIKNLEGDLAKMSHEKLQLEPRIEELEQAAHSLEYSASEIVKLQEVIRNTQAELEKVTEEKEVLKERVIEFEQLLKDFEVSSREVAKLPETIKNLEAQLERALEEKSILQDRIKELEQVMCDSLEKHSHEQSSLIADILKLSEANASLEGKLSSVEAELMQVYVDKEEESLSSEKQISALKQDLADLRSKLELLSSGKATVDDKLANLLTDITTRDEKMQQMGDHLNQLQLEHAKLMAESDVACKSLSELRAWVSELEEEVEKQKLVISESAEGKREAIRQLCFSIEHYRSGYQQLRQLLHGHRRPLVMAT
ncbi:protein NETWORKED 4B-like [Phragmites australis]|uniref:protein NETWORKED 4B-like n=1 Tax=Phragmites australis TaxID=29695 RepID=UPI002D767A89|nr:protein NETWORKED 4B-like [Phragmites australis]XP_062180915.1 protein NETWORKED 4B-like [Phragmites australis]